MLKLSNIPRLFRIPRPASFLYIVSLQTGASLIVLSLLLNKVSGLYGILAILTGYHISLFQLSMYIYSLLALSLTAFLSPYIRTQAPLQCLALAWFYVLDSLINTAYTLAFGASWFLVVSQHHLAAASSAAAEGAPGSLAPGSGMLDDTAGFTSPKYNVSSVAVGTGANGVSAAPQNADAPAGMDLSAAGVPTVANGVRQPEGFQSIVIIVALLAVRVYFSCVMLAFARQCIHQYNSFEYGYAPAPSLSQSRGHSRSSSAASTASTTGILPVHSAPSHSRSHSSHSQRSSSHHGRNSHSRSHRRNLSLLSRDEPADPNPFSPRRPEGQGWKGQLGRALVMPLRSFFLSDDDELTLGGTRPAGRIGGRVGRPGIYDPDLDNTWMMALNRKQSSSNNPSDVPNNGDSVSSSSAGPSNGIPSKNGTNISVTPVTSNSSMASSTSQRNKLPKLKSKGLPGLSGLGINSLPSSPFNFTFPSVTSPAPNTPTTTQPENGEGGVSERERRRRSGTGPPPPMNIPPLVMTPVREEDVPENVNAIVSPVNGRSRTSTPLGFGNRSATPNSISGGLPRGRSTPRLGRAERSSSHGHSFSTS